MGCLFCGISIKPNRTFCGSGCANKQRGKEISEAFRRYCQCCDALIPRTKFGDSNYSIIKYCSPECRRQASMARQSERMLAEIGTAAMLCTICGAPIKRGSTETYAAYSARKYCSQPCAWEGISAGKRGTKSLSHGYVRINVGRNERIAEQRYVAQEVLGRSLTSKELVHHINLIPSDNRPENLLVCTKGIHRRLNREMGKRFAWSHFPVFTPVRPKRNRINARNSDYDRQEHRRIAERAIGRVLVPSEVVHHINCVPWDNDRRNLVICSPAYHVWIHEAMAKAFVAESGGRLPADLLAMGIWLGGIGTEPGQAARDC